MESTAVYTNLATFTNQSMDNMDSMNNMDGMDNMGDMGNMDSMGNMGAMDAHDHHGDTHVYLAICPFMNNPTTNSDVTAALVGMQSGADGMLHVKGRIMGLNPGEDYFA